MKGERSQSQVSLTEMRKPKVFAILMLYIFSHGITFGYPIMLDDEEFRKKEFFTGYTVKLSVVLYYKL